jgi:hypothetical protein
LTSQYSTSSPLKGIGKQQTIYINPTELKGRRNKEAISRKKGNLPVKKYDYLDSHSIIVFDQETSLMHGSKLKIVQQEVKPILDQVMLLLETKMRIFLAVQ